MRRKQIVPIPPRDVTILTISRLFLECRSATTDAQLVELLAIYSITPSDARMSLARLEAAGQLRFGGSGWEVVDPRRPFPFAAAPFAW